MPFVLPKSIFFHVPKTGGSWVCKVLKEVGIPINVAVSYPEYLQKLTRPDDPVQARQQLISTLKHGSIKQIQTEGKFTFAFIRHPLSYYQSYWLYKQQRNWSSPNNFDIRMKGTTFLEFMHRVLQDEVTQYTRLCRRHFGHGYQALDFVGKQENLQQDLITALTQAGEQFDEAIIRSVRPINVSKKTPKLQEQLALPPSLYAQLLEREREPMEAFGYTGELRECAAVDSVVS